MISFSDHYTHYTPQPGGRQLRYSWYLFTPGVIHETGSEDFPPMLRLYAGKMLWLPEAM
ncbi:MAG: hypothetical protein ACUVS4_05075 [Chloroflexaceae bacterium]